MSEGLVAFVDAVYGGRHALLLIVIGTCAAYLAQLVQRARLEEPKRPLWISVEANIAAGKTTLLERAVPLLTTLIGPKGPLLGPYGAKEEGKEGGARVILCPEPVEQWERSGLLELSYSQPAEYLFPAQCNFFTTRIDAICAAWAKRTPDTRVILSERSPFSDKMFATLDNRLPTLLKDTYMALWSHFQRLLPVPQPDGFIYLRPKSLDTCMDRMVSRARASESSVTREYQQALREKHDAEFSSGNAVMPNGARVPVLVLDASGNFRDSPEHAQELAKKMAAFIKQLST